jgi:hypothetical protein
VLSATRRAHSCWIAAWPTPARPVDDRILGRQGQRPRHIATSDGLSLWLTPCPWIHLGGLSRHGYERATRRSPCDQEESSAHDVLPLLSPVVRSRDQGIKRSIPQLSMAPHAGRIDVRDRRLARV